MGSKVSQPVRILALVGLLGALALGAGFALLGKSSGSGSDAAPKVIKPLHPHKHVVPAVKPKAKPVTAPAKHAVARKAKAKAAAPKKVEPKPHPTTAAKP